MQFIKNAQMLIQNGQDTIRIDCGPSYYVGIINLETIPEDFTDNYKEIIQKSFSGYKDDSFHIEGSFEHEDFTMNNRFNIKISLKNKFYSFDKQISIPLIIHQKNKVDYLEEKLEFLTKEVDSLKLQLNTKVHQEIEEEDSDGESEDEQEQSDEESENEKQTKKNKNVIIGKKNISASKTQQIKKL